MGPSGVNPRMRRAGADFDDAEMIGMLVDGRYRLDARVGKGGMGVVYRAEQVALRRTVAIKLLPPATAAVEELRARFEREALAIGRIDHPNCVGVYDFGSMPSGALYLAMEFLQGESLGDLLDRETRLVPERALRIVSDILRGLEHVHAAGITHRDIKPENIVLVRDADGNEVAKLLDFGIAKILNNDIDDDVKLTQAGMAFGTPIYMSPEQAFGDPVDGRSDLYGVSVMLFEMIAGKPPFYADDKLELMSMHTSRPVPSLREIMGSDAPPVDPALEALIRHGLAKRIDERIGSATEYLAAIEELGKPTASRTSSRKISARVIELPTFDEVGWQSTGLIEPPRLSRWSHPAFRWITIGVVAAGVGLAIAFAQTRTEPIKTASSSVATVAANELVRGDPAAAIRTLEANKTAIATDAQAQLQLGHAYAATRDSAHAMDAYRTALTLSPTAESDTSLRANLTSIAKDHDAQLAMQALQILITLTHDDQDATTMLLAATVDAAPERRAVAMPLVHQLKLDARVDWLRVWTLELHGGSTCDARRAAVAKLRALGDGNAIDELQKAVARRDAHGNAVNACLLEDAQAAMVYLSHLPSTHP